MINSETSWDTPFYITGGTLPPDATSYVERHADRDLLTSLLAGDYCYVLNSRQMGKSSLSVRAMNRLNESGARTVFLDLTRFGGASVTPDQWYVGMLAEVGRALNVRKEALAYWRENQDQALVPRFFGAIREVALQPNAQPPIPEHPSPNTHHLTPNTQLVLFIDEIDAIKSLPFSTDEFFAALRECYNRRVQDEVMQRLTVCLVGSATPSDLIADTRTSPFNIGRRIELRDFTLNECMPLAEGLNRPNARELVIRAFHWTNGHPYLTQSLCAAIAEDSTITSASGVDSLAASLFFDAKARERNPNLADVSNRILSSYLEPERRDEHRAAILDLYGKVLKSRPPIDDDETNRLVALLKLAGITRSENGQLKVRNRVYERVFDRQWIETSMPDAELRRLKAAYRKGVIRTVAVAGLVVLGFAALSIYGFRQARSARLAQKQAVELRHNAERTAYFANAQLIEHEYDSGAYGHVADLLEENRNSADRGIEWDYYQRLMNLQILTLKGHTMQVCSAAFSPDGKRIVTASNDKSVRIWDAATGREIAALKGHTSVVFSAFFSPDSKRIVTASDDKTARIWDAATGTETTVLRGHTEWVQRASFSPDGKKIVTASNDKTARIWDAATGRETAVLNGHTSEIFSASFSPDCKRIVTASFDRTARIWDVLTGRETAVLKGHTGRVYCASFSPDGKKIVTASEDRTSRVWDMRTGKEPTALKGHIGEVYDASFSPDGKRIVTASEDHTARVWDATTGEETTSLKGHGAEVCRAAFSPDGKRIVTASSDSTARIWDAATDMETASLKGHTDFVDCAAFSPDGRRIVTAGNDNTARIWDANTGREITLLKGHEKTIDPRAAENHGLSSASFSPDGRRIVTAAIDRTARIWDAATGRETAVLKGHEKTVNSAAFSPDGKRIVTASDDHTARIWDSTTGRETGALKGHTKEVLSASFSPDGKRVVTASWDDTARIWDAATGREIASLKGHSSEVNSAAYSPDGRRIVTASLDNTARIWDASTGRETAALKGHLTGVYSAAFSPDGKRVVTASFDHTARVWNAATGKETALLKGHSDWVLSAVFSPDGRRIVTASADKTARIWFFGPDHFNWAAYAKGRAKGDKPH